MEDKKTLWIIIDHPMQITTAMGLAIYFKKDFNLGLIISKHCYWQGVDTQIFNNMFNSVHWFERPDFSKSLLREILKIFRIRKILKKLSIKKQDIFLILSNKVFLENILISLYPDNRRVVMNPDYLYEGSLEPFSLPRYKEKIISRIWNWTIIPLFKLIPVLCFKHTEDKKLYAIHYKKGNKKLFNVCLSIKNINATNLKPHEVFDLSMYVKTNLPKITKTPEKKCIVFFGESLTEVDLYHIEFTNKCLRYIEIFFPGYNYIYKPHPNDLIEANNLVLGKFSRYEKKGLAELFFIENLKNICCCFSVASTALRHAIDMGIKSYYFLNLYKNYSSDFTNVLMDLASDAPPEAFIGGFESAPQNYQITDQTNKVEQRIIIIKKALCP
jgi:hypothetical protein